MKKNHVSAQIRVFLLMLCGIIPGSVWAQENAPLPLSYNISPYLSLPIGADTKIFATGGGANFAVDLIVPSSPLTLGLVADYAFSPSIDPSTSLSILGFGGQAGLNLRILPFMSAQLSAAGGAFYATTNESSGTSGSNPWFKGGLGLDFALADTFSLSAAGSYRSRLGLLNDVMISLTAQVLPSGKAARIYDSKLPSGYLPFNKDKQGVKLIGMHASPVFPVFMKYYDNHAIAKVIVHNYEDLPAENLSLSVVINGYMDGPRDCQVPLYLSAGQQATVDLQALFTDRLLTVAETTKLSMNLKLNYTQNGKRITEDYTPSIEVQYKNAMTWDDDRHVAAFISARDPATFGFSRGVLSATRDDKNPAISHQIQTAMVMHAALKQYGLLYVKDPSSAFNKKVTTAIDSLQFPQETLQLKTGDCDDLTILWCSLLESVGIETAAITIPGHILMAFALDLSPKEALDMLGNTDDFIIRDNRVWVPLETTMIKDDFMKAWAQGSQQVATAGDKVNFYSIRDAWTTFGPVVASNTAKTPAIPNAERLAASLNSGLNALIKRELKPRVDKLLSEAKKSSNPSGLRNKVGILYARYGQYDEAIEQFSALSENDKYQPALVNLGNTYLMQNKYKLASDKYQAALKIKDTDKAALKGLALAYNGLSDRKASQEATARLAALDKPQADQLASLGAAESGTSRASAAAQKEGLVLWNE